MFTTVLDVTQRVFVVAAADLFCCWMCVFVVSLCHTTTPNGNLHTSLCKPSQIFAIHTVASTHARMYAYLTMLCSHTMQHHPPTAICDTEQRERARPRQKRESGPAAPYVSVYSNVVPTLKHNQFRAQHIVPNAENGIVTSFTNQKQKSLIER